MTTTTHQKYYVPHDSAWPIVGALALLLIGYGAASWISQLDQPGARSGPWVFAAGFALLVVTLFGWFGKVIDESQRGLYSTQLDRSFRQCMSWFIFSEVMFFLAFFGALF
ncbi:MAG TPA: cytochrome c oxidase subunit 3, partial [Rhodocyclaceae bacterium]|nr:cytochrome c oxidase subunit 3 [Rhodocyclaceae bacterium]